MNRHSILMLAAAVLAIAAQAQAVKNASHERILKLSAADRTKLFATFLAKRHDPCPGGVGRTFFQGMDGQNAAYWDVACQQGMMYSVRVSADAAGSTQVIQCRVQEKASGVPCFVTFSDLKKRSAQR